MNLKIRPHDGQIGIHLNKSEQDTLQQTAALAQDLLHQLDQRVNDGQTDPVQVEALRNLATGMLTGARGIIATSNQQAPNRPTYTYDYEARYTGPMADTLGQRTAMTYDTAGSLIRPVNPLGQRTTMTNDPPI
jgi:YD repeat-containing protein